MDFVRQFCDSIRINPSQRQELIELYKIEKIGKEIYYNRKYIQELLRVISTQQMLFSSGFTVLLLFRFTVETFHLMWKKVLNLFEDILLSGSDEKICTNIPANCRLIVQVSAHLYPEYQKLPPVIQILPLHQNPTASPDYNMNLETFCVPFFRSCAAFSIISPTIITPRPEENFPVMNCFVFLYYRKETPAYFF